MSASQGVIAGVGRAYDSHESHTRPDSLASKPERPAPSRYARRSACREMMVFAPVNSFADREHRFQAVHFWPPPGSYPAEWPTPYTALPEHRVVQKPAGLHHRSGPPECRRHMWINYSSELVGRLR